MSYVYAPEQIIEDLSFLGMRWGARPRMLIKDDASRRYLMIVPGSHVGGGRTQRTYAPTSLVARVRVGPNTWEDGRLAEGRIANGDIQRERTKLRRWFGDGLDIENHIHLRKTLIPR